MQESKIDFDFELYRRRLPVRSLNRLEAPALDRGNGFLGQTVGEPAGYRDILNVSILPDQDIENHYPARSGSSGVFAEGRMGAGDALRRAVAILAGGGSF